MIPAMDALVAQCAPAVPAVLMHALVRAESAWRPLAIGLDGTQGPVQQPRTLDEAVATAKRLTAQGVGFSVGLAQIHASNVRLYGLSWEAAFDPCRNLAVGQKILWKFYHRASASGYTGAAAVWAALRGYNSGSVDRAASNEYANRVFAYMSSAAPQLQMASTALATSPVPGPHQPHTTAASAMAAPPHRPGESLDIFERTAGVGF